jgi:hypothetical protein
MEHSQKTVENTERVRNLTKAAYEQLPEEKTFLEKNRMKVEHLILSLSYFADVSIILLT